MQLNHLDQSVYNFVNAQLPAGIGFQCYTVFTLAEQFGLKSYDETFVSLCAIDDGVQMDDVRDVFIEKVVRLVTELITSHQIQLEREVNATLDELIEIAHFLHLVQRLEDTTVIEARVFDELSPPRMVFIDMLAQLSHLEKWRAMELITSVDKKLIIAMQQMIQDRSNDSAKELDHHYHQTLEVFSQFVGNTECLGLQLLSSGYTGLLWETVTMLTPVDLEVHFTAAAKASIAQCALDLLSLAMICTDTYQTPALSLQKKMPQYLSDAGLVTQVHAALMGILADFTAHQQAWLQAKKLQGAPA